MVKETIKIIPKDGLARFKFGIGITLLAGILWGISATLSESLLHTGRLTPLWVASWRLFMTGFILMTMTLIGQREKFFGILKDFRDVRDLLSFTFLGLTANSISYQMAVKHTNGATATVMQYIGPVFILIGVCWMTKRRPTWREATAIVFVLIGTSLISTSGGEGLSISIQGLFWSLMAAVTLAAYNVLPGRLLQKWGSQVVIAYGMFLGGLACFIVFKTAFLPTLAIRQLIEMGLLIVLGTVLPYSLYMKGVELIGPVRSSMLVAVEPIAATLFTSIFLNTRFYFADLIGFAFITTTIFLLAKPTSDY